MTKRTLKSKATKIKVIKLNGYGIVNEITKAVGVIHMQSGAPFEVEVVNGEFEINGLKFKQGKETKTIRE